MLARLASVLAFMAALAAECAARPVTPIDQARHDKVLAQLRDRLATAVAQKDIATVTGFVAADAEIGSGSGPAALITWLQHEPALWEELARTLALGGRMTRPGQFEAPYTRFVREKGVPRAELGIVIGRNIAVRESPTERALIMARYSHETAVVKRWWVADAHAESTKAEAAPPEPWVEIQLPSKRLGYVQKRWVRWVGALRIGFAKRGGRWWVVRIGAGN